MAIKRTYTYGEEPLCGEGLPWRTRGQVLAQHDIDGQQDDIYFYLHDRLGSVRLMIDESAYVRKYYTYNPFGEVIDSDSAGSFTNPFMFTGQYYDSEIAEYYLRARQYNPHIALFTSRDPVFGRLREPMTLHPHLYCTNDPVNRADPSGKWAVIQRPGVTASGKVDRVFGSVSGPMFFYGVGEGYNVFWGYVSFKSVGRGWPDVAPRLGAGSLMLSVGWSENAMRPEDLAGRYTEIGGSGGVGPYSFGYTRSTGLDTGTTLNMYHFGIGFGAEWHSSLGRATVSDAVAFEVP